MNDVIILENLVKEFNDIPVVDGLNLKIHKGEIFGFLGPNGAGKSTTINMIMGLLEPTKGKILIEGNDKSHFNQGKIGICPQDIVLWDYLTCKENLHLMGKMYEIPEDILNKQIIDILDKLQLIDKIDSKVSELSGGMKRRLNIAMAIIHDPDIIVLDEPSEGLDPQSRILLWEYILYLKENKGKTIILTTHLMDEADKLSDRIGIIDMGKLLKLDTASNLKKSIGDGDIVEIELGDHTENEKIIKSLKNISEIKNITSMKNRIQLRLLNAVTKLPDIIHVIDENNSSLKDISIRQNTLEDVFIELTGKKLRN